MSEEIVEKPLTPSEKFAQFKADKAAGATPEAIAAKAAADEAVADAAAEPPAPEKRKSGDERKFGRIKADFTRQLGKLQQQIADLKAGTPASAAAVTAAPGAAPKREDFTSDELFADAKTAYAVQKALDKQNGEQAQNAQISETIAAYNQRIEAAPAKYEDWDEVLAAGKGAALSVDLFKECPPLFWAIARSKFNDAFFYEVLKDSTKLQSLIDTYKSGKSGEAEALIEFHRFEGELRRDPRHNKPGTGQGKVEAKEPVKASADAARVVKPKPSAEVTVKGGSAAPASAPPLFVPGTKTLNPAYKAYMRARKPA